MSEPSGTFVNQLVEHTAKPVTSTSAEGTPVILAPQTWKEITPAKPPLAEALEVSTLAGLADYIAENRDTLDLAHLILTASPSGAQLRGPLDRFRRRELLVCAKAEGNRFGFGGVHALDEFSIALQTQFVQTPARDDFLRFCSSVTEENVRISDDDGISQQVTTRQGVTLKSRANVPSPVTLAPFRTFREVEQPESPFVVRVTAGRDGPLFALFEADGGAWKVEATARVAAWLAEKVTGVPVIR